MKRVLLLVAALAALGYSPVANAAVIRGVVIAKDAKRHAVVTAAGKGAVRTIRLGARYRQVRLGQRLVTRASRLPDGTFLGHGARAKGRVRHARLRATVIRSERARLILSAGRSVFVLRLRSAGTSSLFNDGEGSLETGDQISCDADVGSGGLTADPDDVDEVGHTNRLELEGIYLDTSENRIELAVARRGRVFVNVPEGMALPEFEPGDEIALVVRIEPDGSFTLIRAENEDQPGDDDDGVDFDENELWVLGLLKALNDDYVAVKVEGRTEPVKCARPESLELPELQVGQLVKMHCKLRNGQYWLLELRAKDEPESSDAEFTVNGFIAAMDESKMAVRVEGREEPVTCLLHGQNLLGFAAGEFVQMHCHRYDDMLKLASLKSDHAFVAEDGRAEFTLDGVIIELSDSGVAIQAEHHPEPVRCAKLPGQDLSGFAVGNAAEMHCHNYVATPMCGCSYSPAYVLASLRSETALLPEQ